MNDKVIDLEELIKYDFNKIKLKKITTVKDIYLFEKPFLIKLPYLKYYVRENEAIYYRWLESESIKNKNIVDLFYKLNENFLVCTKKIFPNNENIIGILKNIVTKTCKSTDDYVFILNIGNYKIEEEVVSGEIIFKFKGFSFSKGNNAIICINELYKII